MTELVTDVRTGRRTSDLLVEVVKQRCFRQRGHSGAGSRRSTWKALVPETPPSPPAAPVRGVGAELEHDTDGGRRRALAEAYEQHGLAVRDLARRLCAPEDADAVVREVFLDLWRRPGAFDGSGGPLRAYLLAMTRSRSIAAISREPTPAGAPGPPDPGALLGSLPASQREAITLAQVEGNTYHDVAEAQGVTDAVAMARIRHGLVELRALLAEARTLRPAASSPG